MKLPSRLGSFTSPAPRWRLGPRIAPTHPETPPKKGRGYFFVLSLTTLGVVFGDIGTSPLYAMREAFHGEATGGRFAITPSPENVLGILSLIFWAFVLVVSIKYLSFVLRADNEGEGGIIALMALVHPEHGGRGGGKARKPWSRAILVGLGIFGAALLYGDGMITPAISVLSAVEGLPVAVPSLSHLVIPLAIAVLIGLFLLQRRGTAAIGKLFGPIMLLWFLTIAVLGVRGIALAPQVLAAIDPRNAIAFFGRHGIGGFLVLGAVFLAVTGAEALYADMGHFGKGPIRFTWFAVALPALVLNYFGQGALLLVSPASATNPFFALAPSWALIPLVILATSAAIIASQAIISGAFSLTAQAVQLGYSPRVEIRHTSEHEMGQIYVPPVNWLLMISTVGLVLAFRSSSALAGAYGVAVATDMVITSILFYVVAREHWGWNKWGLRALVALFLVVELSFLGANTLKILQGGWFPLTVAAAVFLLMTTWRQGREVLRGRLRETSIPIDKFMADIEKSHTTRVRGHAVYMTGNPTVAPPALVKNLQHNRVLHMRVALLSIVTEDIPHVARGERMALQSYGNGFYRVVARYGFMDEPDALEVLRLMREKNVDFPLHDTTFFLGRERLISTDRPGMARWRERLFSFMSRNAQQATEYFRIPPDRVIEVGSQVEI
ncbi:MAG TPA: potassium transporter Kup [Candidatus Thermoplasmatota archaeon]|nr:potassium transporter Kup [Candidatus Thermoplasmatota archaeon]